VNAFAALLAAAALAVGQVPGQVVSVARAPGGLVLLLSPRGEIGPATLAVADASGRLRSARLDQTWVGTVWPTGQADPMGVQRLAGLAVDPAGGHAYVLGAGEPVAEVELAEMTVAYHDLAEPASLLHRLRRWLQPTAQAKGINGPQRQACWLGDGKIALTGEDVQTWIDARKQWQYHATPAGLTIVDARNWSARKVDSTANQCLAGDGSLVATGVMGSLDAPGTRLSAYDAAGRLRFHVDMTHAIGVFALSAGLLYAYQDNQIAIVDLGTGALLPVREAGPVGLVVPD